MSKLPLSFKVKENRIKRVLEILSTFDVVFKGGTSLSLAYGIIDRFSEDIDISFYLEEDLKRNRKATREGILKSLEKETWIKSIDLINSDIMIHFENEAPSSEYDRAIKPNVIKLELQDVEKKRSRVIASKIRPFADADFKMNVAEVLSTFSDKTALLFEMTIGESLPELIDDTKTMPRHLYDYLKISKYLEENKKNKSISSYSKYTHYLKRRILSNILKSDQKSPRKRYDTSLWETHILKNKSVFSIFETFLRANDQKIIQIINSVVYPGSRGFTILLFLKAIKTNFKYYEKLLKEEVNKNK